MNIAYVFNGQGAEVPGMGIDFYHNTLMFKEVIDAADAALYFDLPGFLASGDFAAHPDWLQPALVAYGVALHEVVAATLPQPTMMMGLSLGEYSALIAANAISLTDGLKVVSARGHAMAQASQAIPGGMIAVLSGDRDYIDALCASIPDLWTANFNGPKQIVLAGREAALQTAVATLAADGIKTVTLNVSGGFHSPLMASAQPTLRQSLAQIHPFNPAVSVISTTALTDFTAENLQAVLVKQVASATRFTDAIQQAIARGVDTFVELGAKPVLSKMIKRIDRTVNTYLVSDCDALAQVQAALGRKEARYGA